MGNRARKRRTRGEIPPRVPLSNNHTSTTLTACPGPTTGFLVTIHATPQCRKCTQNCEFNKPGSSIGRPQLNTQPTPPPLKHHLADVLALHQHLRKPEPSLVVQLRTGKNGFNAFLYQALVPTVPSPPCSCGRGSQTAKHILIHCSMFSAAWSQLRDSQGHLPDFKQLLSTPERQQKAMKWLIQMGILGQYRWARGFIYPPGPSPLANN